MVDSKTSRRGGEPQSGGETPGVLYHFTAVERVAGVGRAGIIKGDVPITPGGGYNAPWLTDDPSFGDAQGWSHGSFQDKQRIRFTVEIPEDHQHLLKKWSVLAQEENVDPHWYEALNKAGGGTADHWYVYHGVIPPSWIIDVQDRDDPSASESLLQKLSVAGGREGGTSGGCFAYGHGVKTGNLTGIQVSAGVNRVGRGGRSVRTV